MDDVTAANLVTLLTVLRSIGQLVAAPGSGNSVAAAGLAATGLSANA